MTGRNLSQVGKHKFLVPITYCGIIQDQNFIARVIQSDRWHVTETDQLFSVPRGHDKPG